MTNSTTDLAWAAGFLDGDGCFTLTQNSSAGSHETSRGVLVTATQKKRAPLEKLAFLFGGAVRPLRKNATGTMIWQWALTSKESVLSCIEQVQPFLVGKQDEAEIVRQYAKTMGAKRRGRKMSPMIYLRRRRLIVRLEAVRSADA